MNQLKILCFLNLIILIGVNANAQSSKNAMAPKTNYPGYVITPKSDTISGYLRFSNLIENQEAVQFFKNTDDKKYQKQYKPEDIVAYQVGSKYYESVKYNYTGELGKNHFFLCLIDGPVSVYKWYEEPESRLLNTSKPMDKFAKNQQPKKNYNEKELVSKGFFKKLDGELQDLRKLNNVADFKKEMIALVDDDQDLAKKIAQEADGYKFEDRMKIIEEYNAWYLSKSN